MRTAAQMLLTRLAAAVLLVGCSSGNDQNREVNPVGATGSSATNLAPTSGSPAPGRPLLTPTEASNRPPTCRSADLRVTLGEGGVGLGSVYRPLVFTNTGSRTCQLRGFPSVSYAARDGGHQVGPAAVMSGPRGGVVRLVTGEAAKAKLQLVEVVNFDAPVCKPTPVRGLRVHPPGDTASLFVPMDGLGCGGKPPAFQLVVQAIMPTPR